MKYSVTSLAAIGGTLALIVLFLAPAGHAEEDTELAKQSQTLVER